VAWDVTSGTPVAKSIYDPNVVAYLGLFAGNVSSAKGAWGRIGLGKKPAGVQYIMIAGTDHRTDMAVSYDAYHLYPVTDYAGDGVVPTWSAAPPGTSSHTLPGDHTGMFRTQPFRQILYTVLDAPMPAPLISEGEGAAISFDRPVYAPAAEASVLLIPDRPTTELESTLRLRRPLARRWSGFRAVFAGAAHCPDRDLLPRAQD
jgi:hypothetical protein